MSFRVGDDLLLGIYKTTWTKFEDLKNIELSDLRAYDDRYIKNKIRIFGDKVYINFRDLNVPENDIEYESFTAISIDSSITCKYI